MSNEDNRDECPSRRGRQHHLTYALLMSGNPVYGTKRWKELRAQVLAEEPTCHWCRKKPSTQADHVIELDAGGDPYDRSGIVGSCASCNARRGAIFVNKKTANRIQNRNKISFTDKQHTQSPPSLISPNQPEPAVVESDLPAFGRVEPRLETPSNAVDSFGAEVAALAESVLKITLMPWQVRALNGMLGHDGTGRLCANEAVIGTGRQNGKSWMLRALCAGWALKGPEWWGRPQEIQIVANKKKRAMETWRFLATTFEKLDLATVRRTNGDEAILCHNGSVISMGVARADEHGGSPDLLCVDELWDISPEVLFDAFRPSQIARPNPLLACFSTAGDQSSTAMQMLREQALHAIDKGITNGIYWCEWSPPPGVNMEDRQWWPWSNPALGTTIQWRSLEKAFAGPDRGAWLRAHGNLWIASADSWLPFGLWADRVTQVPIPDGGILCVDNSLDNETLYCGVRAVAHEGGVIVTTEFVVDSQSQMWAEVNRVMQNREIQLRINPTLHPHTPPDFVRRTQIVGYKELKAATPICRGMILEDKLRHTGEIALSEHVTRAVQVKVDDGAPLSSQKSPGPITLARCMVFAAAEAGRPTRSSRAALSFG